MDWTLPWTGLSLGPIFLRWDVPQVGMSRVARVPRIKGSLHFAV